MVLAPDGASFVTEEELSGESAGRPATAKSLWDANLGEPCPLPEMELGGYSPDGRTLAAYEGEPAGETARVEFIDVKTVSVSRTLRITKPANQRIYHLEFPPTGESLFGSLGVPDGTQNYRFGFWDLATGRQVATLDQDPYLWVAFSPGGEMLATTSYQRKGPAKLYLFDTHNRKLRHAIMLDEHAFAYRPAFSPDGKWIAVGTQQYVDDRRTIDPDSPQPRIHLIDVAAGNLRETLVAPSAPTDLAFNPSGTLLASSGYGFVHLWNLADPPIGEAN